MSANKALPHVLILPEDDANRQIAVGFQMALDWAVQRRIQVLDPAGGWLKVVETFASDHVRAMERFDNRSLVLLIDCDGDAGRLDQVRARVPGWLAERVFVLGAWSEPEGLKRSGLGSYESIGAALAVECRRGTGETWRHDLLRHNDGELARLRERVRPFLFA